MVVKVLNILFLLTVDCVDLKIGLSSLHRATKRKKIFNNVMNVLETYQK
jgi:hypothetical protein